MQHGILVKRVGCLGWVWGGPIYDLANKIDQLVSADGSRLRSTLNLFYDTNRSRFSSVEEDHDPPWPESQPHMVSHYMDHSYILMFGKSARIDVNCPISTPKLA